LPASDFDEISGKGCPMIFFSIFSGPVSGRLLAFFSEYSASPEVTCFKLSCSALIQLPPFKTIKLGLKKLSELYIIDFVEMPF
jgi:hypothetical protein